MPTLVWIAVPLSIREPSWSMMPKSVPVPMWPPAPLCWALRASGNLAWSAPVRSFCSRPRYPIKASSGLSVCTEGTLQTRKDNAMKFVDGQAPYIIAEIGANHNGDMDLARLFLAQEVGK